MEKYLSLFSNGSLLQSPTTFCKSNGSAFETIPPEIRSIVKDTKVIYNKEQLDFINSNIENCKLLGIPGGGKTQSIIGKVIHHYSKKDITSNNQFLILTFSRRACNDFITKGKKQNSKFFNRKNIKTLHSLAGKIIYKVLEKKSSSQDTIIVSCLDILEKATEKLIGGDDNTLQCAILEMPEFSNLKIIFVDEAQDISEIQYKFILKLSELISKGCTTGLSECKIIMIGDPNQNIYQFQNGCDRFLVNHPGKTFYLLQNYRSTPHIVRLVNHFRPWESLTQIMTSTKSEDDSRNKKPVIFTGTIEEIIKDVTYKILNSTFLHEEIAIIGPVKKSKPVNDNYSNIGLSLFTNLLNNHGIKYIKHYEDTNNNEQNTTEFKKIPGHVNLFTVHGSKGLEFDQVFLLNFHTNTFGIVPTEEKYKEFKYLWYVGLSRAAYDLHIYIDKSKGPWNELKLCPPDLYEFENHPPIFTKPLIFKDEIIPMYRTVTEILGSKKCLDDALLYQLEKIFDYSVETIPIFEIPSEILHQGITNYREYSALYGHYVENIFNFYYHKKWFIIPDFVIKLKKIINHTIIVPKKMIYGYKMLKMRCPFIAKDLIRLSLFSVIKNSFKKDEEILYSYLCETMNNDYESEFFIDCENDVISYSKERLLDSIKKLEISTEEISKEEILQHIFNITLYYYQRENETAYLWNTSFIQEMNDLEFYIDNIIEYANNEEEKFTFHPTFHHSKLPLVGELDMCNKNKIVDIKFSAGLNVKHVLQVFLYHHLVNIGFDKDYELELWNFHTGCKYIIKFEKTKIDVYELLKILSKAVHKKLEHMIFFYDLETTGFMYAHNKMDILERHFEEYSTGIVPSSGLLKPVDVPFIPFNIIALTGITKEQVDERGHTFQMFKREMTELFDYCTMPIFIAHNGNSFDHKILVNKNIFAYENCKFLDSKMIIRLFLDHPVTNKSLSDIFQHLFRFTPVVHRAESDVKMLISIFRKLGISEEKILSM
jgi:hypothetical protein